MILLSVSELTNEFLEYPISNQVPILLVNLQTLAGKYYVLFIVIINRPTRNSCRKQNYQDVSVPTLHTRRLQAIATIMYKVKNKLAPPYIADVFEVNNSQHHLRNSEFFVPRFRTVALGKHSISYLGPVI